MQLLILEPHHLYIFKLISDHCLLLKVTNSWTVVGMLPTWDTVIQTLYILDRSRWHPWQQHKYVDVDIALYFVYYIDIKYQVVVLEEFD